jgi:hypothetical protein
MPHPAIYPPLPEKIRSHAHSDKLATFYLITAIAVFLQGIVKILCPVNVRTIFSPLLIQRIHITVGTAGTDFLAAMPWIPDIMHVLTQPLPLNQRLGGDHLATGRQKENCIENLLSPSCIHQHYISHYITSITTGQRKTRSCVYIHCYKKTENSRSACISL